MNDNLQDKPRSRNLWFWVVAAFLILIAAWTALIFIAVNNRPAVVEIEEP